MDENCIVLTAESEGSRLDRFLAENLDNCTRSFAQGLLDKGSVLVNDRMVKKNYTVKVGDEIIVTLPELLDTELVPQDIPLDIIYEDDDIIVVNKPRGMVVHPAPGHPDGTLVNALMFHCGDSLSGIGGEKRPGIVHRIDKDTSGLIAVAKNDPAHQALSLQLADHSMYRLYHAIARGHFKDPSGTVDRPIGRHPTDRKKMSVQAKISKPAVTHWQVLEEYRSHTYITCRLETGRTHQIRVHMASIGHPLLGDYTYGAPSPEKGLEGQCLHAKELSFIHPRTGERLTLTSELPPYFTDILTKLRSE